MKKADFILIISITIVALFAYFAAKQLLSTTNLENGSAVVLYQDEEILEIYLEDGTYRIIDNTKIVKINEDSFLYTVSGTNGDVVIEYKNHQVRVIEEISPKHICQIQGWSSSPLTPLTCLPNNVVIIISGEDDISFPDSITR